MCKVCEDPWLFLEAKRGPRVKNLGNTGIRVYNSPAGQKFVGD
jgi:hypothetical protein